MKWLISKGSTGIRALRSRHLVCLAPVPPQFLQPLKLKTERPASGEAGRFRLNPKILFGGAREDRTPDLLNAIQALSHLSYDPTGEKHRADTVAMRGV